MDGAPKMMGTRPIIFSAVANYRIVRRWKDGRLPTLREPPILQMLEYMSSAP